MPIRPPQTLTQNLLAAEASLLTALRKMSPRQAEFNSINSARWSVQAALAVLVRVPDPERIAVAMLDEATDQMSRAAALEAIQKARQ